MAAVLIGTFGALVGSFLNVVVYRVPRGLSVAHPPSACGSCGHAIRARDNIPIVSWMVLRGRCRDCAAPISIRYPLVELVGAIAFAAVAWRFLPNFSAAEGGLQVAAAVTELVAYLYFVAIGVALALIDLDTHRLPNAIVLPAYPISAALLGSSAAFSGQLQPVLTALAGFALLGGLYLVLALVKPDGMGMGDVKLAGVIGLFLGWLGLPALAVGAIAVSLLGGIVAAVMLLAGKSGKHAVPFGPILLSGAWVGILFGDPIAVAYLSLFGIT